MTRDSGSGRAARSESWRHGTEYGYRRKGCDCAECTAAHELTLAHNRALKETYRGSCRVCGKPTTGCDGPGKYELCVKHANEITAVGKRTGLTAPEAARLCAYLRALVTDTSAAPRDV